MPGLFYCIDLGLFVPNEKQKLLIYYPIGRRRELC